MRADFRATAQKDRYKRMDTNANSIAISCRRGKHNEKEFKIFLAAVSPETKASFKATLDHESLDWGWYPLDDLAKLDSHPVVEILVHQHMPEIKAAFGLN